MKTMLTKEERNILTTPDRHDTGGYDRWREQPRQRPFVVDIDARPLAALIDSAACGSRVYELMSIQRPSDILHYLWVTIVALDDDVIKSIRKHVDYKHPFLLERDAPLAGVAFTDFDDCFSWQGDDTDNEAASWRNHIDQPEWNEKLSMLFEVVGLVQERLRSSDDFLLQNEIRLIDQKLHRRDFFASLDRRSQLTHSQTCQKAEIHEIIAGLIAQKDVRSVSCPFGGLAIWRILVGEQVRRAEITGKPADEAFPLAGPDEGLGSDTMPEDWGGYVHIPYEGMVVSDLTLLPDWRNFLPEQAGADGSLTKALNNSGVCRYLLVPIRRDFGELGCATREQFGDWVLYRNQGARMYS